MTEESAATDGDVLVFNSPLETGSRSVIILTASFPEALTLDELVALDHLIVHTEDIGGPPSLHPPEETRAAELLVRRNVVEGGLRFMGLKGLVTRRATPTGFRYHAGMDAGNFVDLLSSAYSRSLIERAAWLAETVVKNDAINLDDIVSNRLAAILVSDPQDDWSE